MGEVIDGEFPTTAGVLALVNLQAQIDGQERQARGRRRLPRSMTKQRLEHTIRWRKL